VHRHRRPQAVLARDARLREAFGDLDHLAQQQSAGRDELGLLVITLAEAGDNLPARDRVRVEIEGSRQERIQRQVLRLADRFEQIAQEHSDAFLAGPETIRQLEALAGGARRLASGHMQQAAAGISDIREMLDRGSGRREAEATQ